MGAFFFVFIALAAAGNPVSLGVLKTHSWPTAAECQSAIPLIRSAVQQTLDARGQGQKVGPATCATEAQIQEMVSKLEEPHGEKVD
jgi:hypothetical protein